MIFLDANVFLRHLTEATTPTVGQMKSIAKQLFARVEAGQVAVTTSEVVLHEVCYVLQSAKHYQYPEENIAPVIAEIIGWPGFSFADGEGERYLRALEIWEQHPKLGFADSVIAARCEGAGDELATFDRHFRDLPFLDLWQPDVPAPGAP